MIRELFCVNVLCLCGSGAPSFEKWLRRVCYCLCIEKDAHAAICTKLESCKAQLFELEHTLSNNGTIAKKRGDNPHLLMLLVKASV